MFRKSTRIRLSVRQCRSRRTKMPNNKTVDMTGLHYGRLLAVRKHSLIEKRGWFWLFKCDCGKEHIASGDSVRRGITKSCGCLKLDQLRQLGSSAEHRAKLSAGAKRYLASNPSERNARIDRLHKGRDAMTKEQRQERFTDEVKAALFEGIAEARKDPLFVKRNRDRITESSFVARRTEAIKASPLCRGPSSVHALCWSLKSPDGVVFQFKNLSHFIRTNSNLFTPEQLVVVTKTGITRIGRRLEALSPRRKRTPHLQADGWTWHINHNPESLLITSAFSGAAA